MGSSREATQPTSPSSASTSIAVGSAEEEELYYAAGHRKPSAAKSPKSVAPLASVEPAPSNVGSTGATGPTGVPSSFISRSSQTSDSKLSASALAFDSDMSRYPASMTSSIRAHVFEGGLRYHAFQNGAYAFPNDENEQNRDDMKHAMTLMLCRSRHFYAPVSDKMEDGGDCIDLGTGTGIWAIEVGDAFPNANVTGVDLSPIQPDYVPENVSFFVDDFERDWIDPENKFDFIHVRHTIHSIRDRKALLERIFKHLKPGGYVEFQELLYLPQCDDASMTAETPYAFRDFMAYLNNGLAALGGELNAIASLPNQFTGMGFDDVHLITHKCPIGVWPRDKRLRLCGLFMRTAIMDGLRGLAGRPFGTGLGWLPVQIEMFLVDVRKAVMDTNFHTYFPFHVVYARKPLRQQSKE